MFLSGILSWFSFGGNFSVSVYLVYISILLHDIDMLGHVVILVDIHVSGSIHADCITLIVATEHDMQPFIDVYQ